MQEGALQPLVQLLQMSDDVEIQRESVGAIANITIADENKFEVAKSGCIAPLLLHAQSEDMEVGRQACGALANLAEMDDNQARIAAERGVRAIVTVMRSPHVEVQRESGRALANLACNADNRMSILAEGGHQLLISYLLSPDTASQRVGALGVGNLATDARLREPLVKAGALEPLISLARSEDIELEIQRFAVLAIANLGCQVENHKALVEEGALPLLISLSSCPDEEIRQFAAFALVKVGQNAEIRRRITEEGGLEPVLFLSRTAVDEEELTPGGEPPIIFKEVLPALATLSFAEANKVEIARNGGLRPILYMSQCGDPDYERQACCALANLAEIIDNQPRLVEKGCIEPMVNGLGSPSIDVRREAARCLANLATNNEYADKIVSHDVIDPLIALLRSNHKGCERMAAMCLANLATNVKHQTLVCRALEPILTLAKRALTPKSDSDAETERYALLAIANISCKNDNHLQVLTTALDTVIGFSKSRDVRCRQHAIFVLGNLASNKDNLELLVSHGCIPPIISFAFPGTADVQFQAVAALRGLATHPDLRIQIVKEGGLEPLILAASAESVEVQRETAACLANLALSEHNKIEIAKSGCLPALVALCKTRDRDRQRFAAAAIANVAEMVEGDTHRRIVEAGALEALLPLADSPLMETRREVARALALLGARRETHPDLLRRGGLEQMGAYMRSRDRVCQRFGALGAACLALVPANHVRILERRVVEAFATVSNSHDIETRRAVAFGLHNLAVERRNHTTLRNLGALRPLIALASSDPPDRETMMQAVVALRHLSLDPQNRSMIVQLGGLEPLTRLIALETGGLEDADMVERQRREDDADGGEGMVETHERGEADGRQLDLVRETAACLRNLSLSEDNKIAIVAARGALTALVNAMHSNDLEVSHQASGVVANLAEVIENQGQMVEAGVLQHLKYVLRSHSYEVQREAARALANLSAEFEYTIEIVAGGALPALIDTLSSQDVMTQRFGAMGIGNLATNPANQVRIMAEGALPALTALANGSNGDLESQRFATLALCNVSMAGDNHTALIESGAVKLFGSLMAHDDAAVRNAATFAIANLAAVPTNHELLMEESMLDSLISLLAAVEAETQLRAVSALRGLAVDAALRVEIVRKGGVEGLLQLATSNDVEVQQEVLSTLCNLSLSGCIGQKHLEFIQATNVNQLVKFLCSADTTYRLFGAVTLGNLASHNEHHGAIMEEDPLKPLINVSNSSDLETQRCIAYALCNLASNVANRETLVNYEGGAALMPIISLACNPDADDQRAGITALRGIAAHPEHRDALVRAGALEPLALAVESPDIKVHREATMAAFALSLSERNKLLMARSSLLAALSRYAQSKDSTVARFAASALACVAENREAEMEVAAALFPAETMDDFEFAMDDAEKATLEAALLPGAGAAASSKENDGSAEAEAKSGDDADSVAAGGGTVAKIEIPVPLVRIARLAGADAIADRDEQELEAERQKQASLIDLEVRQHRAEKALEAVKRRDQAVQAIAEYDMRKEEWEAFDVVGKKARVDAGFERKKVEKIFSDLEKKSADVQQLAARLADYKHDLSEAEAKVASLQDTEGEAYAKTIAERKRAEIERSEKQLAQEKSAFDEVQASYDAAEKELEAAKRESTLADLRAQSAKQTMDAADNEVARRLKAAEAAERIATGAEAVATGSLGPGADASLRGDGNAALDLGVRRQTIRLLVNLTTSHELHEGLVQCGGAAALLRSLTAKDEVCRRFAAAGLLNLTTQPSMFDAVLSLPKAMDTLIWAAGESDSEVCRYALMSLGNLASEPALRMPLVDAGALDTISRALWNDDFEGRFAGCYALARLAVVPELHHKAGLDSNTLQPISWLLGCDDPRARTMAAHAIRLLAKHEDNALMLIEKSEEWELLNSFARAASDESVHTRREIAAALCNLTSHRANRLAVSTSAVVEPLVKLACEQDVEVARQATATIANMAEEPASHEHMLPFNVVHFVVHLMRSRHLPVYREASRACANFFSTWESHDLFAKDRGHRPLFHIARAVDPACRRHVALAYRKMAQNAEMHECIVADKGVHPLFGLAALEDKRVRENALSAMRDLAANQRWQLRFAIEGGMEAFNAALTLVMEEEARVLRGEGGSDDEQGAEQGGNGALALQDAGAGANAVAAAVDAKADSAKATAAEADEPQGGAVAVAVPPSPGSEAGSEASAGTGRRDARLLETEGEDISASFEPELRGNAEEVFGTRMKFDTEEALKNLRLRTLAVAGLRHLSLNENLKRRLVDEIGILSPIIAGCLAEQPAQQPAIDVVYPDREPTQEEADEHERKDAMFRWNGDLMRHASAVFGNLSEQAENQVQMAHTPNLLVALAHVIEHGSLHPKPRPATPTTRKAETTDVGYETCRDAARALCHLSSNPENQVGLFTDPAVLHSLFRLIDIDEEWSRFAALAVGNLAVHYSNQQQILACGGLSALIKGLSSQNESLQGASGRALYRLATDPDNQLRIVREGGVGPLVNLLYSSNTNCQRCAAMTLCNLSTHPATQRELGEPNPPDGRQPALPALRKILEGDNLRTARYGVMTMCNLAADIVNQRHIVDCGALDALLGLLKRAQGFMGSPEARSPRTGAAAPQGGADEPVEEDDGDFGTLGNDPEACRYAALTLCNLSCRVDNRLDIARQPGALDALVSLAAGVTLESRRAAALTLYNLSSEPANLRPIAIANAAPPLIELLRCEDDDSRRWATMALANFAANVETRRLASRGGGLQALVEIVHDRMVEPETRRYACIALCNLACDPNTREQIVVHGGLPVRALLRTRAHAPARVPVRFPCAPFSHASLPCFLRSLNRTASLSLSLTSSLAHSLTAAAA